MRRERCGRVRAAAIIACDRYDGAEARRQRAIREVAHDIAQTLKAAGWTREAAGWPQRAYGLSGAGGTGKTFVHHVVREMVRNFGVKNRHAVEFNAKLKRVLKELRNTVDTRGMRSVREDD